MPGDILYNPKTVREPKKKILLMLLPFWAPFIPPLGIACLKSYVEKCNFAVKCCDLNPEPQFRDIQDKYMDYLKENIPDENQGNINTVGVDVLTAHALAYINKEEKENYLVLLQELMYKNFFYQLDINHVRILDTLVGKFYTGLENRLDELFEKEQPDVLGVSVFSSNLGPSLFALKKFKEKRPHAVTVLGGGIFSDQLNPASVNFRNITAKMSSCIDRVIIGEGEILFLKLLKGELPEHRKIFTNKDIDNKMLDFAAVGIPGFDDFHIDSYPQLANYASRSCPFQCKFCSETVQWGKYRKKEIKQVVDELFELNEKYRHLLFLLSDSLLDPVIMDISREFISRQRVLYWDGYLRVSDMACEPENTMLWRSGGFYRARLGIESGSARVLGLMDKRITPHQIRGTLKSLARAGIKTTTYWVAGYPGETARDFGQTLSLIAELKDYIFSAECHGFYFHPDGQVSSEEWVKQEKNRPLYSEELADLLMMQSWVLSSEPERKEIHDRLYQFNRFCKKLAIPNPYNYVDWYEADRRWQRLHKTSVPPILELKKTSPPVTPLKGNSRRTGAKKIDEIEGDYDL
jgi:radical SAM superfamily enzyme YgiQ (UPF0313 family)